MNYKPNTIDWKVGDIVIHDADAKKPRMLMLVIRVQKNGLIVTEYIDENIRRLCLFLQTKYKNDKKFLHDPKIFGIKS